MKDPSILTFLKVNTLGGSGGNIGKHGIAGRFGLGGEGGKGGDKYGTGRIGRNGKQGKSGKNGKIVPNRANKPRKSGKPGAVSFCLYDGNGIAETSGTPFHIMIDKSQVSKLYPSLQLNQIICSRKSPLIYGQELHYGPVLPINVGGLSCPLFSLFGELSLMHDMNVPCNVIDRVPFPPIPAQTDTRNGTLPKCCEQSLILKVPNFSKSGYILSDTWPWPMNWSKTPRIDALFKVGFELDGIRILKDNFIEEGGHINGKDYDVIVELPIEIVHEALDNKDSFEVPNSLAINENSLMIKAFLRSNVLEIENIDLKNMRYAIHTVSTYFKPLLTSYPSG